MKLGEGLYGEVYRCHYKGEDEPVALKVHVISISDIACIELELFSDIEYTNIQLLR